MSDQTSAEGSSSPKRAKRKSPNHEKIQTLVNQNADLQDNLRYIKRIVWAGYALVGLLSLVIGYLLAVTLV